MIRRGWVKAAAFAAGGAAATGAAQLGLAYGLGVIDWLPGTGAALPDDAWRSGLTWAVWISAMSVIAGAVAADRLVNAPHRHESTTPRIWWWRLGLTLCAGVGALLAVALITVPARAVHLANAAATITVAAGYAAAGLIAGMVLALVALAARAVAANLIVGFVWLWGFAVVAVVDHVLAGTEGGQVSPGFWDLSATAPWYRSVLLPDAAPVLAATLLFGAVAALPAVRRGDGLVGVATSGVAAPLLLAVAYLLTQPTLAAAEPLQLSRQLVVPYAVLTGLAGSLLATYARPRTIPPATSVPAEPAMPSPRPARDSSDTADTAAEAEAAEAS